MLEIKNLNSYYGTIHALHDISMQIDDKQIVCLIGSNGAGKTTLLNSISNMVHCTGSVTYNGIEILGKKPRFVVRKGIIQVPEGRQVFPGLTVEQNLEVGTVAWGGVFGRGSYKEDQEKVYELFPRLRERRNQMAWSLSGGEQQMLAIGRAIMARPKLLMLDEPSMGLAPLVVEELFETIVKINKQNNMPILLVEQNANLAFEVSDYAYVLDQGKLVASGDPKDLIEEDAIIEAYLGKFARS